MIPILAFVILAEVLLFKFHILALTELLLQLSIFPGHIMWADERTAFAKYMN